MCGNFLCVFQRAAVSKVCRDARGTKRMTTNRRGESGVAGASLDHRERLATFHAILSQVTIPVERAEQGSSLAPDNSGCVQIAVHILLGRVMCRHVMPFAAFFVQTKPHAVSLPEVIF